jgi:hypothetical protein
MKVTQAQPIKGVMEQEKTSVAIGKKMTRQKVVNIPKNTLGSKVIQTKTFSLTNDCMVW